MKKRLLSMTLAVCLLVVMIPAAFAAQVSMPTGLEWCKTQTTIDYVYSEHPDQSTTKDIFPGDIVWDRVADGSNEYDIKIYQAGELVDESKWSFSATDISKRLAVDLFRILPRESGTYTFTVQALGNGQDLEDSAIATSEPMEYIAPSAQLGVPTNLRWDGSTARWDPVDGADTYAVYWYYADAADGTFIEAGSTRGITESYLELEDWVIVDCGEGSYAFEVRALSDDVTQIRPGEQSARSGVYNTDGATGSVSDSLDDILSGLENSSSPADVQTAVDAVKKLDTDDLRVAMEADHSDNGVNSKIQELEAKTNISVTTQIADEIGMNPTQVSLTGAALNAGAGATAVTFNISRPAKEAVVPGAYANAVQFDFGLDGAETKESGEFAVPIKIKMPVPSTMVPGKLRILHYSATGELEEVMMPYISQENGVWYATFVVKHFSTFVFAEQTAAATIGKTYYDTLQEAIDAAQSGDTINLYRNHADTDIVKVEGKSLNISGGTYTINPDVVTVGVDCTKTVTGENGVDQVIQVVYSPSGSSGGSSGGGGGGGGSSSKPSASVSGAGGKVTTSSNGTVTITPDEGYQIAKITVNGKEVAIPADGKLTGLTKDDKVVVTFEKIPEEGSATTPFADVADDAWYADAIRYVYEKGMMNGTSSTSFSPNETTTRAMIVTMLHRLENEPSASAAGFSDVASDTYYANAVAWAAANGVVNGVTDSAFAPNSAITREQLAAILYRYAELKGYNVSVSGDLSGYADASQISSYATTAMQWATANGLITGKTSTTLSPKGNATRAEVATILMRFCEKFV